MSVGCVNLNTAIWLVTNPDEPSLVRPHTLLLCAHLPQLLLPHPIHVNSSPFFLFCAIVAKVMTNATSEAVCAAHTSRQWLAWHSITNTTKHLIFLKKLDDGDHEDSRLLYCWIKGVKGCRSCIMSEDAACGWCPQVRIDEPLR